MSMTTDLLPKLDLPYVIISTTYPGASPEKIELSITKPLEQVLATTSGVKNINSVSSENASMIMLEFNQEMNMDTAMIELSGKIDLVKPQLEEGVSTPTIMKMNPDMLPVIVASLDINNSDIKETSKIAKDEVIPSFERIEGVAAVTATGLVEENITITLDSKKIDELNNKVLSTIDSTLSKSKGELDKAKSELESGKKVLERESLSKTNQLVDGSVALSGGKDKLQAALNDLPKLQADLEKQRKDLVTKKEALEWIIKEQEKNNIPVAQEQRDALSKMDAGIKQIDSGINDIKNKKPTLESNLNEIVKNQKELEKGKVILSNEMSKATAKLATGESELKRAENEFEKARDEAYSKANIGKALTKESISKILMAENFSMPAGYIKEGEEKYLVKVGNQFTSLEELKDLVLFNIDVEGVGEVKIEDVGSIEIADNSNEMYAKINGNDGILLSFQKQSTASTAEVSQKINDNIKKLMEENPDMHITALQDQGLYIDIVINSVLSNLVLGGILAVIILFVFLKNIRPTAIIAVSIPISVLFAVVMMYFSGVTINIISLGGLALGIGMLVDNSIVVIENIYRLRSEGVGAAKAAVKGAAQVAGAIAASTLTTICVFLPIVFTHGISRQLFTDMGLTIAYSLIASLIVALTLVPTMAANILNENKEKEHKLFDKFIDKYTGLLNIALKHKALVMISVAVLLVVSIFASLSKGTILMPVTDSKQISVTMEMPKESTVNETREMSNTIIDRIVDVEDIETIGALQSSGQGALMFGDGYREVSFYVLLKDDKKLSSQEVGKLIEEKTSDLECEIKVNSQTMDMSALGGSGINVEIKGNDLDKLKEISKDITELVANTEGTTEVENGLEDGSKETRIVVDKNKAMSHGLTVAQVYQNITEAIKSETTATSLSTATKDYPVILVNDDDSKLTRESLKNHSIVVNKDGKEEKILISDIATVGEEESLTSINHMSQVRSMSVKAKIDDSHNIGLVSENVEEKITSYEMPDGYTIKMGGEKESMDSAFKDLILMISLAIVLIYLIMVAQFQSLLSPFIVLFTIPLAFTGGFLALVITNFEISMISMLGFLILSGIVVNNGIVFVDYVNQLRIQGMEKREALILAGRTRIRPILMTALTTILGLSTLALGIGMGADMIQPMAIVTIGGLTYATILTLFVVPIMYDILHRKEMKVVTIEEDI